MIILVDLDNILGPTAGVQFDKLEIFKHDSFKTLQKLVDRVDRTSKNKDLGRNSGVRDIAKLDTWLKRIIKVLEFLIVIPLIYT